MSSNMLSSYEDNRYGFSFENRRGESDKDYAVIFKDEKRVDPSSGYAAVPFFYFYRFVTREILLDTNIPYYQGFFDIAFYIVYYCFRGTINKQCNAVALQLLESNGSFSSEDSFVPIAIEEEYTEESFVNVSIGEQRGYIVEKVLSENYYKDNDISYTTDETFESIARLCIDKSIYSKCRNMVWNVINERVLRVYHNKPTVYQKYKERLVQMLQDKGFDVECFENIYFIESSFFTLMSRNVEGADNILSMYDAILSFPEYGTFLLIYYYSDTIRDRRKIKSIEPDLKERIKQVERMFNSYGDRASTHVLEQSALKQVERMPNSDGNRGSTHVLEQCIFKYPMLLSIPIGAALGILSLGIIVAFRFALRFGGTAG